MSPNTWCALSTNALYCGFFIEAGLGFTTKSLSKDIQFFLDSEPLSKRTRFGSGYLHTYVWLNMCDTCAKLLSMIGTSTISNQPAEGSMKVIAVSVISTGKPLTSFC